MNDPQFQYVLGQSRETFHALLAAYVAESRAAVSTESCMLDQHYGPLERQTFDFFAARGRPLGTLLYFHAGYWQSRDKATFRFIAPAFTAAGLNVALVNYPLCPAVSIAELVQAAKASVPVIRRYAATASGTGMSPPLVVSGHSAGGHIAVELALSRWASTPPMIAGVIALSGIFDLTPLIGTSLNERLLLREADAIACSPLYRMRHDAPPALFVVGGAETPAFVHQSRRIHNAWTGAGNASVLHIEENADHFSLLRQFTSPGSPLFGKVCDVFGQAAR